MRILHVSDTHLGYTAYRKTTEDGINQREIDIYDAFKQFVDYAVETKPDLILHTGDLFDSVRPTNRAITTAVQQILRISKKEIPIIIISGNHETPRLRETGNIFNIFEHLDHVYPVYNGRYEKIILTTKNNDEKISIHAVPQCQTKKEYIDNLKKISIDKSADYNIVMLHGCVKGIQEFSMNDFNELLIPIHFLKKEFDYIALGHYHKYTQVTENSFYSGSTEHLTFAEAMEQKGFIELETNNGKNRHNFIPLKNRPMIDTPPIQCQHLSITEIMKKIGEIIEKIDPKEKIFRINLKNIPMHIYRGIDFNTIREKSLGATHYEIKTDIIKEEKISQNTAYKINTVAEEFKTFLQQQNNIQEKEKLLKLGLQYIQKIETKKEQL
ncbi:MAG: exonuclease SbcCD subunit D [Thermoplasmata archaeon]|nr:MAG: exonuclease SbcCD subunit D [Thermoplasmata archaeon]RLF36881.1 MAG: exonuclease SbcCD subunit D [Thermoplasmata archaeon]